MEKVVGKSHRSVHVISDLVLRFTFRDPSSMFYGVATGVCGPFYAHSPTWRRGVCGPSWSTSCATFLFYVPPREGRWFFSWQGEVDVMPRAARMFMSKYLLGRPRSGRSLFSRARRRLRVEHTLSTGEACRKSYPFACFAMRAISLCFAIML